MLRLNLSNIAIINVKGIDYRCIILDISKFEAIISSENSLLDDCGYIYKMDFKEISLKNIIFNYYLDYLIKVKKLEAKNILINYKKGLTINSSRSWRINKNAESVLSQVVGKD